MKLESQNENLIIRKLLTRIIFFIEISYGC